MKKNWLSRVMSLILAAVLALGLLTGCGDGDKETTEAPEVTTQGGGNEKETDAPTDAPTSVISYPLENAQSISWWVSSGPTLQSSFSDVSESPFHMGLNKMTGVDIEWKFVTIGSSAKNEYNLMLQDEELPNIMFGTVIQPEELYEEGLIYDLTDYLPEYAPDYWAYLNDNNLLGDVQTLDGRVLTVNSFRHEDLATVQGLYIRQDWLDECGLEMPVTLADWENVLTEFKNKYGASYLPMKPKFFLDGWGFASGAGAFGGMNGLNFYVDKDGKVQCAQVQEEWKEFLETMNRWYDSDLISVDYSIAKPKTTQAAAVDGKCGVVAGNEAHLLTLRSDAEAAGNGAVWVAAPYAVTAPGEKSCYVQYRRPVLSDICVITTSSTEEELITALKVLNYGFTEDGMHYWNFGEEGVSFYYDENDKEQWTDVVLNDPDGLSTATAKYIGAYGAGPTCVDNWQVTIRSGEAVVDGMRLWASNSNAAEYRLPVLKYTTEEEDELADIQTTIETYMTPMAQKMMTGEEPLDKMEEFVTELYNLGLEDLLELMQTAYDRQTK